MSNKKNLGTRQGPIKETSGSACPKCNSANISKSPSGDFLICKDCGTLIEGSL